MGYYPIFLDVSGKLCVVVGGGAVAERKVRSLLDQGARVKLISPALTGELRRLAATGTINAEQRAYRRGDLAGAAVAIVATDDRGLNRQAAEEAQSAGVLVNVVDDPQQSTFIVPSLISRGDISIAISTAGKSPALSKSIRMFLEKLLPEELSDLALLVAEVREEVKGRGLDGDTWQHALDLETLLPLLRQGKRAEARERLKQRLVQPEVSVDAEVSECNS